MELILRKKPEKNYALGTQQGWGNKAVAIFEETKRNILALNYNEKIAARDADVTLERDKIKAERDTKILIGIIIAVIAFLFMNQ